MKAIISDIHGNLEALCAVLEDIAGHGAHEIYCLGDFFADGPNPRECVDLLMECAVTLLGDRDLDVIAGGTTSTTSSMQRAENWTRRRQLMQPSPYHDSTRRRREFLAGLPLTHREGDCLFLHGSPRDPVNEYLFPEDIYNQRKMEAVFNLVDSYCFMGHTHIPGIFTDDLRFIPANEVNREWLLTGSKTLCNVGSVGQPRDGDPRACYVLLGDSTVCFRRVEYDIDATVSKIKDMDW